MACLCISTRFLAGHYHGRADDGEPEWPPSPMRLFQALVAAGARSGGEPLSGDVERALRWLECKRPPSIVAPQAHAGAGYRLSVPNNAMDLVARAWARGTDTATGDANPATHRTMKRVRPMYLSEPDVVHFLWHLDTPVPEEATTLTAVAARLIVLGWGGDFIVGHAQIIEDTEAASLDGVRWTPRPGAANRMLRVPVTGTLDDVTRRHARFLERLRSGVFDPPPPLTAYAPVAYQPDGFHDVASVSVYTLLDRRTGRLRSFDPSRRGLTVAAMMRHAVRLAALRSGWSASQIDRMVLGHAEAPGSTHSPVQAARFAYVPLPSIERRQDGEASGAVRRVMVAIVGGDDQPAAAWARRSLAGAELIDAKGDVAALLGVPTNDAVARRYTGRASVWRSVMPVVLPGYDDPAHLRRRLVKSGVDAAEQRRLLSRIDDRTDALLRKAIRQAGFSPELAEHARLDWRGTGFFAGTDLAGQYGVPDHLRRFPRVHVTIDWRDRAGRPIDVAGPCVIGGGRFYGLGLFATGREVEAE